MISALRRMFHTVVSTQLRRNMLSGVITSSLSAAVLLIGYPIYLWFLGYERYGVWLVLATVLSFAQLGNLGIAPAVTKLVAEEHGKRNKKGIETYLSTALITLIANGTVVLLLILLFREAIVRAFGLEGQNRLIAVRLLPFMGFLTLYVFLVRAINAALAGIGRIDLSNLNDLLGRVILVGLAALLLFAGFGIVSLLVATTASYIFMHGFGIVAIRRLGGLRVFSFTRCDWTSLQRILRFGGGVFGGSLINMFLHPFNKLVLTRFAGVSTVPVYEIAYSGAMQIRSLAATGLMALVPEISRLDATRSRVSVSRMSQIYRRIFSLVVVLGLPLYLFLAIAATPLLKLWLQRQYVDELPFAFRLMLLGTFFSLIAVPAFYLLLGLGQVGKTLMAHVVQSVCNVAAVSVFLLAFDHLAVPHVALGVGLGMVSACAYQLLVAQRAFRQLAAEPLSPLVARAATAK